jgi:hypothetical protein
MDIQSIKSTIAETKPKAVYLGRMEMQELRRVANQEGYIPSTSDHLRNPELHKIKYCDCPIYEVTENSHVGYSYNSSTDHCSLITSKLP